jgi:inhibitor of KinA
MNRNKIRIFSLGDTALTVEFGNTISTSLNRDAIALAEHFETDGFPGFIEAVPAYASTTLFYDLCEVRRAFPDFQTGFAAVRHLVQEAITRLPESKRQASRQMEIPVSFDKRSTYDLDHVARASGLSTDEVISVFTASTYRVFMLGFLPGFSYLGEVDRRIATPRRETPRTLVPKGGIGIAGRQTGIYSMPSPGGWQIIGVTDLEMFRPKETPPSWLQPGDEVRFVRVK